ncbi:ABC transporter permease [Sinomonas sp. P10A9]|uniref:ABC transporter permease n=1 Tax=Sinomonas puerhi TaxID=3238584 RepID=A0AB39L7K1_9MICC
MDTFLMLYRQRLRRDRWQLVSWVVGIGAMTVFAAAAVAKTYGDFTEQASILKVALATPAILIFRGLARGPGLGPFTFFEIFTFLALLAGWMSTFMAVRHSRAEEESGRSELISSTPAARMLPLAATVVHGIVANILAAIVVALGFIAANLDPAGSLLAGAATGAVGISFVGIGLLAGEFMSTSRGANAISASLVLVAYLLRGFGDAAGTPGADGMSMTAGWPSWISPIGWGQQTFAYTGDRWWPLVLPLALGAVCIAATALIMDRRDVGAALLAGRTGRADARPALGGSLALAARLQMGSIIGWCIGGLATGLLTGGLGSAVNSITTANEGTTVALRKMIEAQGTSISQLLVSVFFLLAGVLAAACALQSVIRARQEEAAGTGPWLVSQPLGRMRWFADYLALGALTIVAVLLLAALGAWLSLVASGDTSEAVGDVWMTAIDQIPAALIFLAVPAMVFVVWPQATIPAGWTILGVAVLLGVFGGLIGVDKSIQDISPFTHTPVPGPGGTDWTGGFWMLGISAVAAGVALALMRRREVGSA